MTVPAWEPSDELVLRCTAAWWDAGPIPYEDRMVAALREAVASGALVPASKVPKVTISVDVEQVPVPGDGMWAEFTPGDRTVTVVVEDRGRTWRLVAVNPTIKQTEKG